MQTVKCWVVPEQLYVSAFSLRFEAPEEQQEGELKGYSHQRRF